MKEVKMYSVAELLLTKAFECNQTRLAKYLGVNRGVLGRAKLDTECLNTCVLLVDGKYKFLSTTRST